MCNLYRMDRSVAEIAHLFDAATPETSPNVPAEIYPGYPGLVIASGALRPMVWGFPLAQTSKRTGQPLKPKPINNARTDKLDSGFWRASFEHRRCLIPLSAFAEAEGPRGGKTRTWLSIVDAPLFAVAGIWRQSAEWGDVFSMVMTEACIAIAGIHDRMPVILAQEHHEVWTSGPAQEAHRLCTPWAGELAIDRTDERWNR